ncbi:MAG TPA: M23 family metallopeptidase [Roseiarcus sp.]|nr:M23 family metallopeptidase [Roseiarcus sp.]
MTRRTGRVLLLAALIVAACCAALVAVRLVRRSPPPPAPAAVVQAETPQPAAPTAPPTRISTIIDLPGDPVLVRRGATAAPHIIHVDLPIALAANASKFDGDAYFASSTLVSTDGGFMGKFPEGGDSADEAAIAMASLMSQDVDQSDAAQAAGFDDDGGASTPPYAEALAPDAANSSQIEVKVGGANGQPQIKEAVIKTVVSEKISDLLIRSGLGEDSARGVEAATKAVFNIQSLPPGSVAIAEGALDLAGVYRATQLAIYENNEYVGAIALSEAGGYGEGAKPEAPEGALGDGQSAAIVQYNLADGLYSAGVRNNIPEPVIREAIQLIGKLIDLKAPLQADESMRALYSRDFRGKSKSTGKVIYVGLSGPSGPIDCYSFAGLDGSFRCFEPKSGGPVAAPSSVGGIFAPIKGAPITSLFGMRFHPILHILRLHAGIDFGAQIGSIVRSVADGKVEIAGPVSGFGNHVRIKHNGFETSYSHLSEIPANITVGATVALGETVGLSGNTGLSTGPHLHFEYYLNGTAVDPLPHMGTEVAGAMTTTAPSEQDLTAFNAAKAQIDAALDAAIHGL